MFICMYKRMYCQWIHSGVGLSKLMPILKFATHAVISRVYKAKIENYRNNITKNT